MVLSGKGHRIILEKTMILKDSAGPLMVTSPGDRILRDNRGRYFFGQADGTTLVVFDKTGKVIQSVGGSGRGPGEFLHIAPTLTPGDSLFILDYLNARYTIYDPSLRLLRTVPLNPYSPGPGIRMAGGRWLVAGGIRNIKRNGFPLHVVDDTFGVLRSFGADPPVFPDPRGTARVAALMPNGTVVSAPVFSYMIEGWDSAAKRLFWYERRVGWFPDHEPTSPTHPMANIAGIRVDSSGYIWVLVSRVRAGEEHMTRTTDGAGESPTGGLKRPNYDTVIEVVNPRSGAVIATTSIPHDHPAFIGGGMYMKTYHEDPNSAQPEIHIWSLRLQRISGAK